MTTAGFWFKARTMRSARTISLLLLSVAASVIGPLPAAHAAADFVAPSTIGSVDVPATENTMLRATRTPQVVTAPGGRVFAAWVMQNATGPDSAILATRPPGGTWTTETIAPATLVSGGVPIGLAGDGTLTALVINPATQAANAYVRSPSGTWSAGTPIGNPGKYASVALAVNAKGQAFAAWRFSASEGATWAPQFNRRLGGDWNSFGSLSPLGLQNQPAPYTGPAQLPTPTFPPGGTAAKWADLDGVSVAINAAGTAALGVTMPSAATGGVMQGWFYAFTATGNSATMLSGAGLHVSRVMVDVSASDKLALTWLTATTADAKFVDNTASFATGPVGSLTGGALTTGTARTPSSAPIKWGSGDRFTATWTASDGTDTIGVVRSSEGALSGPIDTSVALATEPGLEPSIAVSATGDRLVTWLNAVSSSVQGRLQRAAASAFEPARTVATLGTGAPRAPHAAFDGQGNAGVVWFRQQATGSVAQATGFDAVAPTLSDVVIPESGVAGTPLSFSAKATDVWSTPKLAWTFGDGASEDGASASHAFGAANTYAVRVAATDDVGNTSTKSAATLAAPAPTAAPAPPAVPVDRDRDSTFSDRDCNDDDARVKPGAHDVPGNGVDENCDGKDAAFGVLATTIRISYVQVRNRLTLSALAVRGVRVGDRIKMRCSGPGCSRKPNVERRVKSVNRRAEYDLANLVRGLKLRPGASLSIAVSRDEFTTRISSYTVRPGKEPHESTTCQLPGTKHTVTCN